LKKKSLFIHPAAKINGFPTLFRAGESRIGEEKEWCPTSVRPLPVQIGSRTAAFLIAIGYGPTHQPCTQLSQFSSVCSAWNLFLHVLAACTDYRSWSLTHIIIASAWSWSFVNFTESLYQKVRMPFLSPPLVFLAILDFL